MEEHPPVFAALRSWYELRASVQPILGERLTTLFAHAIVARRGPTLWRDSFRRQLEAAGDDPAGPVLDAREAAVVRYGEQLGTDPYATEPGLLADLAEWFAAHELMTLASVGALIVATNVLNVALELPVERYAGPLARAEVF